MKGLVGWFLQFVLLKASLISLGNGEAPFLDIIAYAGYTFTGMCLAVLGRIIWSYSYYFLMPWTCLCMAIFLVKTMKRVLFSEVRSHESSKQHYLLLLIALAQFPLFIWLGNVGVHWLFQTPSPCNWVRNALLKLLSCCSLCPFLWDSFGLSSNLVYLLMVQILARFCYCLCNRQNSHNRGLPHAKGAPQLPHQHQVLLYHGNALSYYFAHVKNYYYLQRRRKESMRLAIFNVFNQQKTFRACICNFP